MAQASKGHAGLHLLDSTCSFPWSSHAARYIYSRNVAVALILCCRLAFTLGRRSAMANTTVMKASLLLFVAILMLSDTFVAAAPLENVILGGQRQVRREEMVHVGAWVVQSLHIMSCASGVTASIQQYWCTHARGILQPLPRTVEAQDNQVGSSLSNDNHCRSVISTHLSLLPQACLRR